MFIRVHMGGRPGRRRPRTTPTARRPVRRLARTGWSSTPTGSPYSSTRSSVDQGLALVHSLLQYVGQSVAQRPDAGGLEHHLEGLVDPDHGPDGVHHQHSVGQRVDDGGLPAVLVADPLLQLLPTGDVPDVGHDPPDGIGQVVDRNHVEIDGRPVGPDRLHLEGDRQPTPGHQVPEEGPDRLDAQRVEQPEGVPTDHVREVVAEQPFGRRADEHEPALVVDDCHHVELVFIQ
jgi:hypothetical protein